MTNSLMEWHLARDNQSKLAKFCEKHKTTSVTDLGGERTFTINYFFDNGSNILVELLKGNDARGYSVADHFQVVDYAWGTR